MREYAKYMHDKEMPDVVRQQSGLLAAMLMTLTPPMLKGGGKGLTKDARKGGERRVESDIRQIFRPAAESNILGIIASRDWGAIMKNKASILKRVRNPRLRELIASFNYSELKKRQIINYLQKQIRDIEQPRFIDYASRDLHDGAKVGGRVPKGAKPYYVRNPESIKPYIRPASSP
jgi:hypothetical protein